ncbi:hypothetical protein DF281_06325 [Kurthia zopfii]|nr:hypothetical protein DF281_06325 [Kurthia zopfii]
MWSFFIFIYFLLEITNNLILGDAFRGYAQTVTNLPTFYPLIGFGQLENKFHSSKNIGNKN